MQSYSRMGAVGRAVAGMLAYVIAAGLAHTVAAVASSRLGLGWLSVQLIQALLLSAVTVSLVLVLHTRVDRRPLADLGLHGPRAALLGAGIVAGSAGLVFGLGAALGYLTVTGVDVGTLLGFLALNTVLAVLLEALPEELAFRGYAYGSLAGGTRPWLAALGTTALFVAGPTLGNLLGAGLGSLAGVRVGFTWGGLGDPVAYAILLAVFGAMLVTARIASGSVYACMAAHLTFLTVNRILVAGDPARTGVHTDLAPGVELLVLGYLVLAAVVFALLGRVKNRSGPGSPRAARPPARLHR